MATPNRSGGTTRTRRSARMLGILLVVVCCGVSAACAAKVSRDAGGPRSSSSPPSTPSSTTTPSPSLGQEKVHVVPDPGGTDNPVLDANGAIQNVTFYYQGINKLIPGADLSALGSPSIVVTTPKSDERSAVAAIHARGAKAFRYVQFYWAPDDESYEGINLAAHPDWAFCRSGDKPAEGRTTERAGHRQHWYFIDTNERAAREAVLHQLEEIRAEGWDGVMFDRGQAALSYAATDKGKPVWSRASTCTAHPHRKGATFADSYVDTLGLARQAGLNSMVNYGTSPFDLSTPMRPNPRDGRCRQHRVGCSTLPDVWSKVDLVLNETGARPKDQAFAATFLANQRSEIDAKHGRRTVVLLTSATLGGDHRQNRAGVYYEWARVKLFNLAVAVNTGDGGCRNSRSGVCNRYALYPELTDVRWGKPTQPQPSSVRCESGSTIRCVWSRTYRSGVDLVNVTPKMQKDVTVTVPGSRCRRVTDVHSGKPVGGACVRRVSVDLPPWSGRPLVFAPATG